MQVAESIYVKHVREARSETKILEEAGCHMPRIALYSRIHYRMLGVGLLKTHIEEWCYEVDTYKYLVRNDHDTIIDIPKVETIAAIKVPTADEKKVSIIWVVFLFLSSAGIF